MALNRIRVREERDVGRGELQPLNARRFSSALIPSFPPSLLLAGEGQAAEGHAQMRMGNWRSVMRYESLVSPIDSQVSSGGAHRPLR